MLKSELLEIISNGENSAVEFKRDDIRPEQLAKEIVAMVNFKGGRVLLGVEDNGSISGVKRKDIEQWVMNIIQTKIHPIVLPFYEEIKIDEEKKVAVISFSQGISKPYVMRHLGREEIYIRAGTTSRIATREQQMRLFELGGMLHTELLPVHGTNFEDLDLVRLENYLKDIIEDPLIPETELQWINRLKELGFMTESEATKKNYCTISGLVLFGKTPRRFLRQAGVRVFGFNSKSKEYKALFDETLDAPLVGRFDIKNSNKRLIDSGIVEKFIDLIKPFITEEFDSIDENFRREKLWFYPLKAIREIFINALAHRDWTKFFEIEVGVYSDRLEIISPGTLANSMTIKKMIAGQRSARNPIIMEVMRDYGYVDYRGMGIRKKVIPLMKEQNNKDPLFELSDDYLKTVFYKKEEEIKK